MNRYTRKVVNIVESIKRRQLPPLRKKFLYLSSQVMKELVKFWYVLTEPFVARKAFDQKFISRMLHDKEALKSITEAIDQAKDSPEGKGTFEYKGEKHTLQNVVDFDLSNE